MEPTYSINRVSSFTKAVRKIRRFVIEWWKEENVVNHKSSRKKMIRLLRRGRDAKGKRISIRKFNSRSARTLENLYEEIRGFDVVLLYNPKTKRVERHAQKVTVLIRNVTLGLVWLEVLRRYPNGEVRVKQQPFTIRETRKRRTTAMEAVMSGLAQELKYYPRTEEIEPLDALERIESHESSVYYGLLSRDTILSFEVNSSQFYRKDDYVIKDYGDSKEGESNEDWVEALIKCFPIET